MDKAITLLSGGIDSPVATHVLQDKLEIISVTFHQEPLSNGAERNKVTQLLTKLNIKKAYFIPFMDVLKAILEHCDKRYYFVLQKTLMFQAAELIAKKEWAKYLITGENLAQVSSQTLSNLSSIHHHITLPVLQPILTLDKKEIIEQAKQIDTYNISKGPEICNLLGPKHPATKTKTELITKELEKLPFDILEKAIEKAEFLK